MKFYIEQVVNLALKISLSHGAKFAVEIKNTPFIIFLASDNKL
jgi:hypothetical protein